MAVVRTAAPLRSQAVQLIRKSITTGEYAPGERLTEKVLGDTLGVSRTVVREALRQLESERLIDLIPNVGPIVRALSAQDAQKLYEVRAALESVAARLAAQKATPAEVHTLRNKLRKAAEWTGSNPRGLLGVKDEFYDALILASKNEIIGEQLDNIQARISQLRRVTLSTPGRQQAMVAELTAIVDAIAAGDQDAAEAASLAHVRSAADIAQKSLL